MRMTSSVNPLEDHRKDIFFSKYLLEFSKDLSRYLFSSLPHSFSLYRFNKWMSELFQQVLHVLSIHGLRLTEEKRTELGKEPFVMFW